MNQKALFTTKATEPVDLKSTLAPVSGNSIKVDFSEWTEIMSKEEHPYYVFATLTNGLRVSFRMWKEASDKGTTRLCFRVRFGDSLTATATSAMFDEIEGLKGKWTSSFTGSSQHRSVMGDFTIPEPAWDVKAVLDSVMGAGLPAQLYYKIGEVCPLGTIFCGETKFMTLFAMSTARVLQDMLPPAKKESAPSLRWGSASYPVICTKPTSLSQYPNAMESINKANKESKTSLEIKPAKVVQPSSPQPFAAPHPKDKLKAATATTTPEPVKPAKAKTDTKPAKKTTTPLH